MLTNAVCRPTVAVSDIERAKKFYGETLGLKMSEGDLENLSFECGEGTRLEVYQSTFAGTAKSTVAGFRVDDVAATMEALRGKGVTFEDYDMPGLKTENGLATLGEGKACWFKDPDGNTFAVLQGM